MFSICGVLMNLTSAPRYDIDAALDFAQCHAELGQVAGETPRMPALARAGAGGRARRAPKPLNLEVGLYPIVTFQYSSTTLCQVSYHIQYLFFESDNRI
jgi:hypothetical protein